MITDTLDFPLLVIGAGARWLMGRIQRLWEIFKGKRDARILVPLNKKYLDHTRSRDPISRANRVENLL
jgi:hypothetical protein